MKRYSSRREGFTLAEFMIASTIFMIVSLGFTFGLIAAMKTQVMAIDHYRGTSIARNRIQRARCVEFSSLPLLAESLTQVDLFGNQCTSGTYYRSTMLTNVTTKQTKVTVDVYYIETNTGRTSSAPVKLETKITDGM